MLGVTTVLRLIVKVLVSVGELVGVLEDHPVGERVLEPVGVFDATRDFVGVVDTESVGVERGVRVSLWVGDAFLVEEDVLVMAGLGAPAAVPERDMVGVMDAASDREGFMLGEELCDRRAVQLLLLKDVLVRETLADNE